MLYRAIDTFVSKIMQKISKIFLVLATAICGLFCGCYEGVDVECFDSKEYISIHILSTTKIDSADIYLNGEQVCHINNAYHFVKPASKEYFYDKDFHKVLTGEDLCDSLEKCPSWYNLDCYLRKPPDKIRTQDTIVSMHLFEGLQKKEQNIIIPAMGGNNINVISEQDSVIWFGYKDNPMISFSEDFRSPASSNRAGCYDGYCVATLPIVEEEYCYDE